MLHFGPFAVRSTPTRHPRTSDFAATKFIDLSRICVCIIHQYVPCMRSLSLPADDVKVAKRECDGTSKQVSISNILSIASEYLTHVDATCP